MSSKLNTLNLPKGIKTNPPKGLVPKELPSPAAPPETSGAEASVQPLNDKPPPTVESPPGKPTLTESTPLGDTSVEERVMEEMEAFADRVKGQILQDMKGKGLLPDTTVCPDEEEKESEEEDLAKRLYQAARKNRRVIPVMWMMLKYLGRISRVNMSPKHRKQLEAWVLECFQNPMRTDPWVAFLVRMPPNLRPSPTRITPLMTLHFAIQYLLERK